MTDNAAVKTILVVDDDRTIRDVLELYLHREGYNVITAGNGPDAMEKAGRDRPDLLVLDLMLPGLDGYEVCRRLRAAAFDMPILMLTARGEEYERITGLTLGADDYVVKPFSPGEVMARIKAILRRIKMARSPAASNVKPLTIGGLTIDPVTRLVNLSGQEVALTAKEFDLLHLLASHPRQVFTREQLLDRIWGYASAGETSTVTVHIRHLREKIETDPGRPRLIETVWGVGYRFREET